MHKATDAGTCTPNTPADAPSLYYHHNHLLLLLLHLHHLLPASNAAHLYVKPSEVHNTFSTFASWSLGALPSPC